MLIGDAVHVIVEHPVARTSEVMNAFIDHVHGIGELAQLKFAMPAPLVNVQYEFSIDGTEALMFRFDTKKGDLANRAEWLGEKQFRQDGKQWRGEGPWNPALSEENDGRTFAIMRLERSELTREVPRCADSGTE